MTDILPKKSRRSLYKSW